jgi:cbb3-type cytochrome oxidase subunit 3
MPWLIPITVFFIVGLAAIALAYRYKRDEMYHRERMAAMDKNLPLPESSWQPVPRPSAYLLRGLIWIVIGFGIIVWWLAFWLAEGRTDNEILALATIGLIPIGVGAAYLYVRKVESAASQ